MTQMKRFMGSIGPSADKPDEHTNSFIPFFLKLEGDDQFPFAMALKTLEELEQTAQSESELLEYMMEDIVFTSIYATFYEHLFITINENSHLTLELIDKFSETGADRESLIAQQTQHHFSYILNNGECSGCEACDNHGDVDDLIEYYQTGDLVFFINLYLGMQTITYALEQLLYDTLPVRLDLTEKITAQAILEFRQYIVEYTDKKLANI
ncbi:MAG: hypothetical protein HN576_11165 [Bacteriovoracaceae bacterium]|jgi:hypothetical protein|nr:hypothetical protein [Bacteriovoracaceae bacterium]